MDTFIEAFPESTTASAVAGKKFGIRAAAYIIDFICLYLLDAVAGYPFGLLLGSVFGVLLAVLGREFYFVESESRILTLLLSVILNILYFTLFEWLYGASPGKVILRMRVVDQSGAPPSFRQALTRAAYRLIDAILFGLVAYQAMKPPWYQRNGDKSAHTLVVGAKDPFIRQTPDWWKLLLAAAAFLILSGLVQILCLLPNLRIV